MTGVSHSRRFGAFDAGLLSALLLMAAIGIAAADDGQPQQIAPAAQAAPATAAPAAPGPLPAPPAAADRPGFLHDVGAWWKDSFGDLGAKVKATWDRLEEMHQQQDQQAAKVSSATQDVLKGASKATQDAASALVRLPSTRMFELRDRCPPAANGAPDCQKAAAGACRSRGFKDGQPLDVSSQEECPAQVIFSGRDHAAGECTDKTFVLRIVCQ